MFDHSKTIVHDEKWNAVMRKTDGSLSILADAFINSVVHANKTWKVNVSRETQYKNRRKKTQAIAKIVEEGRYKDLWMEINKCESNGLSDKPVLDESKGTVVHDKKGKEKLWAKHFGLDGVPVDVLKVIAMEECLVFPDAQAPGGAFTEEGDDHKNRLLTKEQGTLGSWRCTAQVAILYEIAKRRSIRDQATFIAFIDCSKAYDKIPQGALLRKLKSIGITGHLLKVIKLLYEDPRMCIRVGSSLSPVFNYHCEVQQVSGVDNTINGLMFADDAIILAGSKGEKHEMCVNASKCAIIEINSDRDLPFNTERDEIIPKRSRRDIDDPSPYLVMGKSVPIHCESKERKALGAMYYLLTSKNMPVFVKSLAIKAKQQPIVTYGDEVWGMSTNRCKDIITNEACRLVLMLGIASMANIATVKRARAVARWPGCKTWITDLSSSTFVSRQWTWVNENIKCLKRYAGWNPGQAMTKEFIDKVFSLREQDNKTKIGAWAEEYELIAKPFWI
ncbi:hypothetical protein P3W45_000665 [Vairimorpha bombi]